MCKHEVLIIQKININICFWLEKSPKQKFDLRIGKMLNACGTISDLALRFPADDYIRMISSAL